MKTILCLFLLLLSFSSFSQNAVKKAEPVCETGSVSEMKENKDLQSFIAKDNDCPIGKIKFLAFSQTKNVGMYSVCVNGNAMRYKMVAGKYSRVD